MGKRTNEILDLLARAALPTTKRTKAYMLEELEAVKEFITMTEDNISHDETRDKIIEVLNNRIPEIEHDIYVWDWPVKQRFLYEYLGIEPKEKL